MTKQNECKEEEDTTFHVILSRIESAILPYNYSCPISLSPKIKP
jgi:hypothetical protein